MATSLSPGFIRDRGGFSLVEIVMALGLISFCFVGVIGLLPAGLNQQSYAARSTVATQLAMAVATDLRGYAASETKGSASERFGLIIPAAGQATQTIFASDAMEPLASAAGASYRVRCVQVPSSPGSMQHRQMHLVVDWPVENNQAPGAGRIETLVALNVVGGS